MRNILLQENKNRLFKEHKLRVLLLVLIFIFFTLIIALLFLSPSYLASRYKESNTLEYANVLKRSVEIQEKNILGLTLNDTKTKLQLLSGDKDDVSFVDIVRVIIKNKSDDIKIDSFLYTKDSKDGDQVLVTGIASDRSVLLQFQKDLKNEVLFSDIILPTSNLASDRNIEFSIRAINKL
jgi:hypothetical protein